MGRYKDDETVRRRSAWLIPLSVFGVTFVLSAVLLLYYLAPRDNLFNEQAAPTSRSDIVALSVAGRPFHIPANYLMYDSARGGGEKATITIYALLPDLSGWSNWATDAFASNAPDSDVVFLTIHKDKLGVKEGDKLTRVYADYLADRSGHEGLYGLHQYAFRSDTGYRGQDLFVGQTESGTVVLRCDQLAPEVPSPSCLRETPLAPGVSLTLRFKRAHLESWRDITVKVEHLLASFRQPAHK